MQRPQRSDPHRLSGSEPGARLGIGLVDSQDVDDRIATAGDTVIVSVGIGMWLILAVAVVSIVTGSNRQRMA